ncbi:MAG: capsular biosynthesis protein [Burkholderiaceae bacterium]
MSELKTLMRSALVLDAPMPETFEPGTLALDSQPCLDSLRFIQPDLAGFLGRRVLMLQGPMGPFFSQLAVDLTRAGAVVLKVDFNGGDRLFSRSRHFHKRLDYRGTLTDWPETFTALVCEHRIDTILMFGDCRPVHQSVIQCAKALGLEVGVFEEGYLRPDYITIERDGVNKRSSMPRDPSFYRALGAPVAEPTTPIGSTYRKAALWGMLYYLAASLGHRRYRRYQHHRPLGWRESRFWVRTVWRKLKYLVLERHLATRFISAEPPRFFLVALQTSGDAQVRVHSPFGTVERFIAHVIRDFAAHAPADVQLVIKHHPLDRGFTDHGRLIRELAQALGVTERCHYLHDQHLPSLLRRAVGVVTINSTVGLSAIGLGLPVKVCGESVYDIEGLVYRGPLARFWVEAPAHPPDCKLWTAYHHALIATSQFNGSFYKRHPAATFLSGVFWGKRRPVVDSLREACRSPPKASSSAAWRQSAD